jgi:hypothetical protein
MRRAAGDALISKRMSSAFAEIKLKKHLLEKLTPAMYFHRHLLEESTHYNIRHNRNSKIDNTKTLHTNSQTHA